MIPRRLTAEVERALARQAAVALIGPRQVGKTTLALAVAAERNALYLDLEDRDDRYPISAQVEAIGLRRLAEVLAAGA